jgi:hypothetical protein
MLYLIEKYRKQGLQITTIDVKNAYNSIPHKVVNEMMTKVGLNHKIKDYVKHFLSSRYCVIDGKRIDGFNASVP